MEFPYVMFVTRVLHLFSVIWPCVALLFHFKCYVFPFYFLLVFLWADNPVPCYLSLLLPHRAVWGGRLLCSEETPISRTGKPAEGHSQSFGVRKGEAAPASGSSDSAEALSWTQEIFCSFITSHSPYTLFFFNAVQAEKLLRILVKVKCSVQIVIAYCDHIWEIHLSLAPKSLTSSSRVWCRLSQPDWWLCPYCRELGSMAKNLLPGALMLCSMAQTFEQASSVLTHWMATGDLYKRAWCKKERGRDRPKKKKFYLLA